MVFEVRPHETSPWQRVRVRFDVPKVNAENAPAWAKLENEDDIRAALLDLPKYEVVCGERRWRVSGELISEGNLPDLVPAVIEEMSDSRALELQLIENLQRQGLSPMEEAEGIVKLLELRDGQGAPLYTRASVASKIGCSEMHVGRQLKIVGLRGTPTGNALEAGKLPAGHALLLAGVLESMRDGLLKRVLAAPGGGGVMPRKQLEMVIHDEYQVELRGAQFDREDERLVPLETDLDGDRLRGGRCGRQVPVYPEGDARHRPSETKISYDCPFADASNPAAVMCTNPECFRMKTAAAHALWMAAVNKREGREDAALSIEDAAVVFDYSGRKLAFNSGYVELDSAPDESELKSGVQSPGPWKKLIRGQGVPVFYAKDSAHKVHEIVKRDLARKAAHLNGHLIFKDSDAEKRLDESASMDGSGVTGQDHDQEHEQETLARQAELEAKRARYAAEVGAIVDAAETCVRLGRKALPTPVWTVMVMAAANILEDYGALAGVLARRQAVIGLDEEMSDLVSEWTMAQKVGFVVEALIALSIDEDDPGDWLVWAKPFGVDLKAVRKKVLSRLRKPETGNRKEEEKKAA
jgi:ParB/RepB/Spo0J family partition protein